MRTSTLRHLAVLAGAFALMFATRWPLVPKYLYYVDNVNFALALKEFNPARHQPQPPGYPLYVGLTKALHWFVPRPEDLFPVSGIIGSALALYFLWRLGTHMLGAPGGIVAALLLAVNPVFWLAGVGNYVRVYLALGAVLVAWVAWQAWQPESPRGWFYGASIALGLMAGFRPELGAFLLPLLIATGVRRRRSMPQYLLAVLLLVIGTLSWLGVMAAKVGGPLALYRLFRDYLRYQSAHYSLLYGATLVEAAKMAASSVYWYFAGALSWVWAIRFPAPVDWKRVAPFLSLWFFPSFLFHTFIHIHNADQTLASIPVLCLAGAWVLCRFPKRRAWACAAAVCLNVVMFLAPVGSPWWTANYSIARYFIESTNSTFAAIEQLRSKGRLSLICHKSIVAPHHISYYFPSVPVITLDNRVGDVVLPETGVIAWVLPSTETSEELRAQAPWKQLGPLLYVDAREGMRFQANGHRFSVGPAVINFPAQNP